eukprot:264854-Pyramimonas_sp.AAC.1
MMKSTLQDAKKLMPKMFKQASVLRDLQKNVATIALPNEAINEAFVIIKTCRELLRPGSGHVLEVACSGLLGTIYDVMFDKGGVVKGGADCSKDALVAAEIMFKEGVKLKAMNE